MRPLGYRPSPPDARDRRFHESRIAAAPARTGADSFDYRAFDVARVQISGSCVGQSIAGAAALSMAIASSPIAFPSALFAYTGARLLDRAGDNASPLVDEGSIPRLAMMWLRTHGLVAEERWPEHQEKINAVPPLDAWEEGECAQLEAFYRISEGSGSCLAIRGALARGYCPIFAMTVDRRYEEIGAEIYDGPGGEVLGGHMQVILGYSAIVDAFLVRNTWGPDFGEEGYARIAASHIDRAARDLWVIEAAPEVR